MIKHLPGPWTSDRMFITPGEKDRRSGFVVNGPDNSEDDTALPVRICDLRCSPESQFAATEANARLIAAAPDLLDALTACEEYFMELDTMQPDRNHGRIGAEVRSSVRAAIAKATGAPSNVT